MFLKLKCGHCLCCHPQVEVLFEPFASWLNYQLSPYAAELTQRDLVPTYAFPILYHPGGHVTAHRDVADNYYSLTHSVHSHPSTDDKLQSGLVFIDSPSNNVNMDDPETKAFRHQLKLNDGILYIGPELIHWREALKPGQTLAQVVFAFRPVSASACVSQ